MGTTGLVAQAYGAQDQDRVVSLLGQSLVIGMAISLLLWIGQSWLRDTAADLLLVSDDLRPYVFEYFDIVIWGAPATICSYALIGWLFGEQDAVTPMIVTVVLNLFNMALSYYLVVHQEMGIAGAALGTVAAQYLGAFLFLIVIQRRIRIWKAFSSLRGDWTSFTRVNRDLFIRTVALTFAFGFFYRQSSDLGPVVLAANVVLLQFLSWMSYGIDGFAHAAESLVGKYAGQNNKPKLTKVIKRSFIWGAGLAISYSLLFGIGGDLIASLYTDQVQVLVAIEDYQLWLALLPLGAFVCYIWDGIFIGISASEAMRDSMLLSLIVYVGVYTLFRDFSPNAIWISFILFLLLRGFLQTLLWIFASERYNLNNAV